MLLEDFGSRIYLLEFSSVNEAWLYNFKYDAFKFKYDDFKLYSPLIRVGCNLELAISMAVSLIAIKFIMWRT
jgi:hypothetical protein